MDDCQHRLRCQLRAKAVVGNADVVLDVRREDPVVTLGEHLGEAGHELGVAGTVRGERGRARAQLIGRSHGKHRRRQTLGDHVQHAVVTRSGTVDLAQSQPVVATPVC